MNTTLLIEALLAGVLACCGCAEHRGEGDEFGGHTNWLPCSEDSECTSYPGTDRCERGFCVDAKGKRVAAPDSIGRDAGRAEPDATVADASAGNSGGDGAGTGVAGAGRGGGSEPAPDAGSAAEPLFVARGEACPSGTVDLFADAPEYLSDEADEITFEGVLGGLTIGRYRLSGPNWQGDSPGVSAFDQHFVRLRGKERGHYETVYFIPATIECFTPACTRAGTGLLALRLSTGGAELVVDAGDSETICENTGSLPSVANLAMTWNSVPAVVTVDFGVGAQLSAGAQLQADVSVALHDLYLDGGGRGEFPSKWTATCSVSVDAHAAVAGQSPRFRVAGSVASCELQPNNYGRAKSPATLTDLRFAAEYQPPPG